LLQSACRNPSTLSFDVSMLLRESTSSSQQLCCY
jgi:hypothetical protein